MTTYERPFIYTDYNSFIELFETQTARYKDRTFIRYQSCNDEFEFKALTYGQFNSIATYLANDWCQQLEGVQCVGFIGNETIQTLLAMIAVFKLGRTFFPVSTRNATATLAELLADTNTQYLIASEEYAQMAQTSISEKSATRIKIWESFDVEHLAILASGYENKDNRYGQPTSTLSDIALIIHSSGSTGLPKPLHISNHYMILLILILAEKKKSSPEEPYIESTDTLLGTSAAFHGSAYMVYWIPLTVGTQVIMFRNLFPAPQVLLSVAEKYTATVLMTSPLHLEALAKYLRTNDISEKTQAILKQFKFCLYFSASLAMEVGNYLHAEGLNVRCAYGATELGLFALSNLSRSNQYWYTVKPIDLLSKYCRWEPFDDELYHLTVRGDCPSLCSDIDPDSYYETKDLFREEPPNSGYRYLVRRITDTLSLINSEKTNPITMETEIRIASAVSRCMVVGHNRSHTGVLIELDIEYASNYQSDQITSEVYEAVRAANKTAAQTHSVIAVPEMVYILPPDRRLPSTSKDTVARKEALEQFEKEIDGMYNSFP